jgi:bifunctional DNA-binding transcriptional regulator/antitoxin component of YhaV-PrlF toxin-antitoxin module
MSFYARKTASWQRFHFTFASLIGHGRAAASRARSQPMIIRVSPQWQITIPKALRTQLGKPRQMEARVERGKLILAPIISDNPNAVAREFRPEGVTTEVLMEAMDLIARRRKENAEAEKDETAGG